MPLAHTGVAIGTYQGFKREPADDFGNWYHGFLFLSVAGTRWQCALDVDTPEGHGIAFRVVDGAHVADLGPVAGLAEGWHELDHTSASGALDYLRTPWLQDPAPLTYARRLAARRAPFMPNWVDRLARAVPRAHPWTVSTGDNALDALQALIPGAERFHVFGQRFSSQPDTGVHNVHMNQGDPAGSQWFPKNGTWQDGAVAIARPGGALVVWQVRFGNQSLTTDDQGHPA